MIHIVTGKIDAGKTTRLIALHRKGGKGDGFALIKTMREDRPIYYDAFKLSTGEKRRLIIRDSDLQDEVVAFAVGPYRFLEPSVQWVNQEMATMLRNGVEPLFFDEAGILEINRKGFYPLIQTMIAANLDVVITVREPFIPKFLEVFNIKSYRIVGEDSDVI